MWTSFAFFLPPKLKLPRGGLIVGRGQVLSNSGSFRKLTFVIMIIAISRDSFPRAFAHDA